MNNVKTPFLLIFCKLGVLFIDFVLIYTHEGDIMLINFRTKNFRSYFTETNFSLQATKDDELRSINTFYVKPGVLPKDENELLKSAIIYGPNASGKSNILKGIKYMRDAVLFSQVVIPQSIIQVNEEFSFYKDSMKHDSFFEIEFVSNDTFYRYGFTINQKSIVSEYLYKRVERITNVFKRESNQLIIAGMPKSTSSLVKLNPLTLFISIAGNYQFSNEITRAFHDTIQWFQKLVIVFEENINTFLIYESKNRKYYEDALKMMKQADLGIEDFEIYKERILSKDGTINAKSLEESLLLPTQINANLEGLDRLDVKTIFNVYDQNHKTVGKKEVYMLRNSGFNSEGTKKLLYYLGWILLALDEGRVLLLDELDSKFHVLLADHILQLFNSMTKNRKNGQLISTAHNIMLMDSNMRRDQIYFCSKNEYGESKLVSLSDFKNVRKSDLYSKKYLKGFYSDLPNFNEDI